VSAAAAAAPTEVEAKPKGKKKLLILIGAVVLLLAVGGGGAAWYVMKQKAAAAAEADEAAQSEEEADGQHGKTATKTKKDKKKDKHKGLPVFSPLDPFTVNLADANSERYAQIGITLELEEAHDTDLIKNYMPAIRNNILMVLSHKTAAELLGREGKEQLAEQIKQEALRALDADSEHAPIRTVHFSNFIVQ
jgi:flagellar FliL protein